MKYQKVFDALTNQEFAVIYWSCQGLTYGDIEEKFGYSVSWIQKRATNAHKKFGIDHLLPKDRARTLRDEVCPALVEWIEDHPEKVKRLPQPDMESTESDGEFPQISAIVVHPPGQIIEIPDEKEPSRAWRRWLLIIGIIAFVGYGAYQIGRNSTASAPTLESNVPEFPSIASSFQTQEIPTISPTATILPTESPAPTATAMPTSTTVLPSQTPFVPPADGILFQDDFDNGINLEWISYSNDLLISNGRLTLSNNAAFNGRFNWLELEHPEWKNYIVSLDVYLQRGQSSSYGNEAIVVRKGSGSNIGVIIDTLQRIYWAYIGTDKSGSNAIAGYGKQYAVRTGQKVEITVEGDNYTLRVDGQDVQTVSITINDYGGMALGIECTSPIECPSFDNVLVTFLP